MSKDKELAKKEEAGALAVIDFAADAGGGFEEADAASYAIPILSVLQSGSPQCKKSDGAYIKGASEGMLYNSVTQEIIDGDAGLTILPCHFTHTFNEWTPRESGGGLMGSYSLAEGEELLQECKRNEKGQDVLPSGNILTDTRNHFVLIVKPDGTYEPAFFPLSSTQIKKSKRWMTMMQNIRIGKHIAPMFSQLYKLTTVPESNDKGSWFGVKIEHIGPVTSVELYEAAKQFREMVRSGAAQPAQTAEPELF